MNTALATVEKYTAPLPELAAVTAVGFGLAQASRVVPALNNRPMLTRTILYTLGYIVARQMIKR